MNNVHADKTHAGTGKTCQLGHKKTPVGHEAQTQNLVTI